MLIVGVFIFVLLLAVLIGLALLIRLFVFLFKRLRGRETIFATKGIKKGALGMLILVVLGIILIAFSQFMAATPKIAKENSIAELRKVQLNGRKVGQHSGRKSE